MFRNREIRQFAAVFAAITVTVAALGFMLLPAAGLLALMSAAAYGAAFLLFTRARYRCIARLSDRIDSVLHNEESLFISEEDEGELSVLQSEITKMTLRIREQNDTLKREKEHLADSLADIAHQLRTPLTSANLILSLLKEKNDRGSLLREMGELFCRMDRLITALLKLSRIDAGIVVFRREPVEVRSLIEGAARIFQIPMELHNITLRTEVPEDMTVWGDADWLSESVQNILKNCMESAGDGGCIEVICRDTLLFAEISIHDSGPGFAREELSRLFDRYYRGRDAKTAGYGIGLALCRTVIVRQGGTITAKNHPEGGAVFRIRFPKDP